ncbi:MAG: polysaccharide deacetylase family protein [Solirubrobacteraceae bacterium]
MTSRAHVLKRLLFTVCHRSGLAWLAQSYNRRSVTILCYHGVTGGDTRVAGDGAGLHVRLSRFEARLRYLRRRHNVISLHEYVEARRQGRSLAPYTLVLTFDDGYRNLVTAAAPALLRMQMPATLFVVTDWVNHRAVAADSRGWEADDDRAFLSWQDAAVLSAEAGFEIGSHTCSHALLPQESRDAAREELVASLGLLRRRLGIDDVPFAYPKGAYADWVVELVHEAGYGCAVTTDAGANGASDDTFRLRRVLIGDDDDIAAFAVRISGLRRLASAARERVMRITRGGAPR